MLTKIFTDQIANLLEHGKFTIQYFNRETRIYVNTEADQNQILEDFGNKLNKKQKRIVLKAGFGLIANEIAEEIFALTNIKPTKVKTLIGSDDKLSHSGLITFENYENTINITSFSIISCKCDYYIRKNQFTQCHNLPTKCIKCAGNHKPQMYLR